MNTEKTQSDPIPPEECSHLDWQLGCPRCFFEMRGIADGNLRADTVDSHMEGAVLVMWHLLAVMADMEDQLKALLMGMDLQKNRLAADLIANLRQLTLYMMQLGANPDKLIRALQQGSEIAATAKQKMDSEVGAKSETPVKSNLIITDAA